MSEKSIWLGRDEHNGVPSEPRRDVKPPPYWRLEAVVHTPRPRSLTLSADRRQALFIEDGETSDVWLLDLESGAPLRLTTGRQPAAFWEDIDLPPTITSGESSGSTGDFDASDLAPD